MFLKIKLFGNYLTGAVWNVVVESNSTYWQAVNIARLAGANTGHITRFSCVFTDYIMWVLIGISTCTNWIWALTITSVDTLAKARALLGTVVHFLVAIDYHNLRTFTYCNTVEVTDIIVFTVYSTFTLLIVTVIYTTGTNWKVARLFCTFSGKIKHHGLKISRTETYGHAGCSNTWFKWVDSEDIFS